jgi:hypothetical protein
METAENFERGLTFEKVWAALEKDRKQMEAAREADREQMEKANRELREAMKETDKRIGYLSNRFGEVVEYMMVPKLEEEFNALGYTFNKTHRDTIIRDRKNNIFTEVDAFLENGDCVILVEIKSKLKTSDIDDHVERMQKMRVYADLRNDKRKYYGAIAGVIVSESDKIYALKNGFYVVEPSGDSLMITPPEGEYSPRAW